MPHSLISPKKIYGWDGFELIAHDLRVGLTPGIGGRIMSLMYQGQELLFVDPKYSGEVFNPSLWHDLIISKKTLGFRLWGGDKTWIAPQSKWLSGTPPLDLDAAPYEFSWQGEEAVMTSPVCRETGLQIIRKVRLQQGILHLEEALLNQNSLDVHRGLWNVTQVKRPCHFVIPAQEGTFRSYHHEDPTLGNFQGDLSSKDGLISLSCKTNDLFKVGGIPDRGEVYIYISHRQGQICWKKKFDYDSDAQYAHGSAVEVFNSQGESYAEIELHAPFKIIAAGGRVIMKQTWEISPCLSGT